MATFIALYLQTDRQGVLRSNGVGLHCMAYIRKINEETRNLSFTYLRFIVNVFMFRLLYIS